jgi:hypothetical protein
VLLTNGGTSIHAKFLAGTLSETTRLHGAFPRLLYANARAFGQRTSWPVGYQSARRAVVPPIKESGQVAARFGLETTFGAFVPALGNAGAAFAFDLDAALAANVLSNTAASFALETQLAGFLRSQGSMAAVFDIISRPSASDIAQEVWNSLSIEGGFSAGELLRIMAAALAGKVSGAAGTTVTIRDVNDTRDRIVATVDANGNRSAVTLDGAG